MTIITGPYELNLSYWAKEFQRKRFANGVIDWSFETTMPEELPRADYVFANERMIKRMFSDECESAKKVLLYAPPALRASKAQGQGLSPQAQLDDFKYSTVINKPWDAVITLQAGSTTQHLLADLFIRGL